MPLTLHDWPQLLALVVAGAMASAINAVAGGGTLITFPLLVGFGVPMNVANATNSVALWPGSLAGAIGFLNQLEPTRKYLRALVAPTIIGALLGAWLLTVTSDHTFEFVVPGLIMLATLLLAFQPRIRALTVEHKMHAPTWVGMALQFLVALYGGYFGAGIGIMMLAVFGMFMEGTLHQLNAVKTWLALVVNFVASAYFLFADLVQLWPGLALMAGSIIGGYSSARLSQRIAPDKLRRAIVALGFAMTAWFAYRVVFRGP